jgi:hypothetical protein
LSAYVSATTAALVGRIDKAVQAITLFNPQPVSGDNAFSFYVRLFYVLLFPMISYQLAKKLKEAGFPQSELARAQRRAGYDYVSMPAPSTLIEACKENFGALVREPDCWVACEYISERGRWANAHEAESAEDAVARLWLSLNQRAAADSAA